ncbi:MAG TPA: hypothetical protein VM009_00825 [Terriglobales bacterium]|nr:hypothetical protein [Terriglobales bacterium]
MTTKIELAFPHQYEVEVLPAAVNERPVRIPASPEEVDSIVVKIKPADAPAWVGSFARGFATDDLISGVYAWPDGQSLAVVAAGYGYVLKASDLGKNWVRLQPMPITDVRTMAEQKLILFADFTHIYAYGAERSAWKSERLSWDGVTITEVATNHVFGMAWDAMQDKEVDFVIDVRTGEHTGGARPWAKR